MRLYLMQHGKARSKEEVPDRPLTDEGRGDVQRVAARLVAAGVHVRRVLHSGKTRARQTAEELTGVLAAAGATPAVEAHGELGPNDDVAPWADRAAGDELQGALLVGHLPFLEKLAARLLARIEERKVVRFSKAGVLCLEKDEGGWSVAWFVTPEVA
jgi:phosphohistidine phosphatase